MTGPRAHTNGFIFFRLAAECMCYTCVCVCVCVCLGQMSDPGMVRIICGHHNWIAVAYAQFVVCYR